MLYKELKDIDLKKVNGGNGHKSIGLICPICSHRTITSLYAYSLLKADDMIYCTNGGSHCAPKKDWGIFLNK